MIISVDILNKIRKRLKQPRTVEKNIVQKNFSMAASVIAFSIKHIYNYKPKKEKESLKIRACENFF